jgi:poly-gamma-glutamate synthesis protein (capsule biosynthesis protein)
MDTVTLLLAGDVMTGRGIDQVMPRPLPPQLHEHWVQDARRYVELAEAANGRISAPVSLDYVWGDALAEMDLHAPDVRIVNLETAVTRSDTPWPGKAIHYRMSPAHVGCLRAAGVDACALANNHVLDWSVEGLRETIATLRGAGIATAGAGSDAAEAQAPAALPVDRATRVLLFSAATRSSGVPATWQAREGNPGVAMLPRVDEDEARRLAERVRRMRRAGDVVVVSLHWGANWVDQVPAAHRAFAHRLIDLGAADVVHGHSSHHPLPIEVHAGKLVLHGCGDLINDYEGIEPQGRHRSDLGCLYFPTLDRTDGTLVGLRIAVMQLQRFRLARAEPLAESELVGELQRECGPLGTGIEADGSGRWRLKWR